MAQNTTTTVKLETQKQGRSFFVPKSPLDQIGGSMENYEIDESPRIIVPDVFQDAFERQDVDPGYFVFPAYGSLSFQNRTVSIEKTPDASAKIEVLTSQAVDMLESLARQGINYFEDLRKEVMLATSELAQEVIGIPTPEQQIQISDPKENKKKQEELLAIRQNQELIAKEVKRNQTQQNQFNTAEMIRILGRPMTEEDIDRLKINHYDSAKLMNPYYLVEARRAEIAQREKMIKVQKARSLAQDKRNAAGNLQMSLNAQEGQSVIANAIATAG